jgi:hypothetical protein
LPLSQRTCKIYKQSQMSSFVLTLHASCPQSGRNPMLDEGALHPLVRSPAGKLSRRLKGCLAKAHGRTSRPIHRRCASQGEVSLAVSDGSAASPSLEY